MTVSRRALLAASSAAITSAATPTGAKPFEEEPQMDGLAEIKQIDYTVVFARDMGAMLDFYQRVMGFAIAKRLGEGWVELRAGSNTLALTLPGMMFNDQLAPKGTLSLQLAFRVSPSAVQRCVEELKAKGVDPVHPVTDQPWGHRTVFFRDPDGNVVEFYAEI